MSPPRRVVVVVVVVVLVLVLVFWYWCWCFGIGVGVGGVGGGDGADVCVHKGVCPSMPTSAPNYGGRVLWTRPLALYLCKGP